jgi:hypothetical protein
MKRINNNNIVDLDLQLQLLSIPSGKEPPIGWLKCKVDVAFHEAGRRVSMGFYVCDSNGRFITAQARWKKQKVSVLEEDAMALVEAIKFVSSKGWHNVIFESDSRTLVNSQLSQCRGVSEFYIIEMTETEIENVSIKLNISVYLQ